MSFGIPVRNGLGLGLLASTSLSTANQFSPAELFAAGEVGAWYDPSDLTTLFQDSTGTTPVTAPGQVVGLMLDKSQGLALGSNLFDGGYSLFTSFSAKTGTSDGTVTVSGNTVTIVRNTTDAMVWPTSTTYSTTANYELKFTIVSGFLNSRLFNGLGAGTYSYIFRAGGDFPVFWPAATNSTVVMSNVSVRQLFGNLAFQSGATSVRPTYGIVPATGRRNLLTFTEQFDNAPWGNFQTTEIANAGIAPNGTLTADKFILDNGQTLGSIFQVLTGLNQSTAYTGSIYVKAVEFTSVRLELVARSGASELGRNIVTVDLTSGAGVISGTAWTSVVSSVTSVGDGWWRVVLSGVTPLTTNRVDVAPTFSGVTGNGVNGVLIWGAQFELGSTVTAYQRVGNQFDVTQAGVPSLSYVSFDGVDDWMQTPTINLGSVDEAQAFLGFIQNSAGGTAQMVWEYSTNAFSSNGAINNDLTPTRVRATSSGTIASFTGGSGPVISLATPYVAVTQADISAPLLSVKLGTDVQTSTASQGTGNYLNHPLFIGRRNGVSLPFSGQIYGLIVRFGANLSAGTISATEQWMAGKTGVTI